jgi:formamidase
MPSHTIAIRHTESICDSPRSSHNRWHPDIAPAARIASGETVEIQTRDSLDGQIRPGMSGTDMADITLDRCHPLTGPIYVENAEPGDLLAVRIRSIVTPDNGFTALFPGFGALSDLYPEPFLIHWNLSGDGATSMQLPGVRIPAAPFMGVMGLAPSPTRLRQVTARERAAADRGALAFLPNPHSAVPADPAIANEAWRTVAPHEVGGNMDIRQLVAGSTLYLPVDVRGALFSTGDAHFAQGDGESCGTAVETSATITCQFEVIKEGARGPHRASPSYECPRAETTGIASRGYFATSGLPITADGGVEPFNATLAARNALQAMIEKLVREFGYSPQQAYCIVSVAGDLRMSSVVNAPHSVVSLLMPRSIFGER